MKKTIIYLVLVIFTCGSIAFTEETGIRFKDGNLELYSQDISNRYGMPLAYTNNFPENELPLLFEVYRNYPNLAPQVIQRRQSNQQWSSIFQQLGIDPFFLYPQVDVNQYGPPYGKAWGYYNNKSHKNYDWNDQDLVSLATVRMIEFVDRRPTVQAIKMRNQHPKIVYVKVETTGKSANLKNDKSKKDFSKNGSLKKHDQTGMGNKGKASHGKKGKGNSKKHG